MKSSLPTHLFILGGLIAVGILFRFYNLNWGAPFYFHPDERNIASSISQLQFPNQMNPHFFAYGSLPLYVFYFTALVMNIVTTCHFSLASCTVTFEQAIIVSRFYAAVFSVLLIPLIYAIAKKMYGTSAGIIAAVLATFSVGFIQYAHYGTTEMWLTLFSAVFFLQLVQMYTDKKPTIWRIALLAITAGVLVSAKISTVLLLILPLPILLLTYHKRKYRHERLLITTGGMYIVFLLLTALLFLITNPYVVLDTQAFLGSMRYESAVATGTLPVFYTQAFNNTTPLLFQLLHVYPFLLNPLVTLLFIPAFFYLLISAIRQRSVVTLMLLFVFGTLFVSQGILFVKWTRYMVPTLPFVYLILVGSGIFLVNQFHSLRKRALLYATGSLTCIIAAVFAFSFLVTVFGSIDTRIAAADFAARNLPREQYYLSEVYDLGITPFNPSFPSVALFNFYDLEAGNPEASPEALQTTLENTSFIILPSQRLLKTRLLQKETYPQGNAFYSAVYNERGYRKIYETPCTLFCRITYLGDPVFSFEETANVFDRPSVFIYQKI